jgi:hypothetical protein
MANSPYLKATILSQGSLGSIRRALRRKGVFWGHLTRWHNKAHPYQSDVCRSWTYGIGLGLPLQGALTLLWNQLSNSDRIKKWGRQRTNLQT